MMDHPRSMLPGDSPRSGSPLAAFESGSVGGSDLTSSRRSSRHSLYVKDADPVLSHRLRHDNAILAIALSRDRIYAGTQGGDILVFDLDSLDRIAVIQGHSASVLALCILEEHGLLCSSAGDRFVNVWDIESLERAYCLYSTYDIGDIFCVAYSSSAQTLYIGAQNTSIQWYRLDGTETSTDLDATDNLPNLRGHKFFDSALKPAPARPRPVHAKSGKAIELRKDDVEQYAHFGYVYCLLTATMLAPQFSCDDMLISGGGDGIIKIWEVDHTHGGAVRELTALDDGREEDYSVLSLALDGSFLYAGRVGGQVNVWDLETKQLIRSLRADRSDALSLTVGGGFLFSSSASGHVAMYDRHHRLVSRLQAHNGCILASAVTNFRGRALLVTGGNDSMLAVWDFTDNAAGTLSASKTTSNEQLIDCLKRFVAFKTVSSDPNCDSECRKGASFLRSVFKRFGAHTEMLPTDGARNPVILAKFKGDPATAKDRKTILFYGHYDVVSAGDGNDHWETDPFVLEGIDGYLCGRGISDNKGPIMAAIFACAELVAERALGADVVFLIEGEEECGSRGFENAVIKNKDLIGEVDWILLANSYWLDNRIPCLTYGLRGLIHATVQIESSHPDLHSGVDGSSQLDEPLKDLVMLLSTLTGLHGQVKIPGFYDPIPALGQSERRLYQDIVHTLLSRTPDLGDPEELALSLIKRWREASLTIHRFETSGPQNAAIIPRQAKVALSLRLVPNQEATVIANDLIRHLESQFSSFKSQNRLTVTIDRKAEPWLGDVTNSLFQTLEEAVMEVWGPFGGSSRRNSLLPMSPTKAPRIFVPPRASGNRVPKSSPSTPTPTPTTSDALANGGVMSPSGKAGSASPDGETADGRITSTLTLEKADEAISAIKKGHGAQRKKPLYIREGGSIPAIRFLEKEFDAPAAHLPCGQAGDNAHLNNERLRLVNLYNSKSIFRKVFRDLPQRTDFAVGQSPDGSEVRYDCS